MPKSKKKKKADFQKVKLKVGRRLPKGQNETTTSFKSRTIHVVQQLKGATATSEPRTKRKLVLKDLLPKCDHHNSNVRLSGVEGVTELLVADRDTILIEMANIFRRVLPLVSDRDPLVRQAVLKLFRMVFASGQERKIAGFFPLLSTHLCCAMTHICDDVQQDSLKFFDILLDRFPMEVTGKMSQMLIQIFMEQISTQVSVGKGANKGRTLMINPSSRQSSQKARAKILDRVRKLVSAFLEKDRSDTVTLVFLQKSTATESVPDGKCVPSMEDQARVTGLMVPPWVNRMWRSPYLSFDTISDANFKGNEYAAMLTDAGKLQRFVELLFPLLKQCWAEVCPASAGASHLDRIDQTLSEKSLALLSSVVGVLQSIVECWVRLCQHKEERNLNPKDEWFRGMFFKGLKQLLMPSFPLAVPERAQPAVDGQGAKMSAAQLSGLKLNLSIVEILASFNAPSSGQGADGKAWQADVVTYLLDHVSHCSGADLGKVVTAVLRKVFCNFSPSKKLDKLLKRAHVQCSQAHPLSAEKRMYLALFEALAFDDCSPYTDRLELMDKFFHWLPHLLLQLPKDNAQTADSIVKIMRRGAQQNCRPFITVLRQNVDKLFDVKKGVLAALDPSIHNTMCHTVYYLFRLDPPSAPQLKLFAQNCRLPQVSVDIARTLVNSLDIMFWDLNYDKAVVLKEHQPRFMTFLTGLISGHTKEEIGALQQSSTPLISSFLGIVWNCTAEQLGRHADIVQWCLVRFRGYLKSSVMLSVMQGVWTTKVIKVHQWHSITMAYGILHHWADMVTLAFPDSDLAHVDCLPLLETNDPAHSMDDRPQSLNPLVRGATSTVNPLVHAATSTLSTGGCLQKGVNPFSSKDCVPLSETKGSICNKETLEAVESVRRHLHDFAHLCLSLAYDVTARETVEEADLGSPEAQVLRIMWKTVVHACGASLRILVKMCQLLTEVVQGGRSEKEALTIVRLTTRLLQTQELSAVWGKDQGEAVQQLDSLQASVLKCCPTISTHQWWSDFVYAVDILKSQLDIAEPMQQ